MKPEHAIEVKDFTDCCSFSISALRMANFCLVKVVSLSARYIYNDFSGESVI
jgi:hypothetical protein